MSFEDDPMYSNVVDSKVVYDKYGLFDIIGGLPVTSKTVPVVYRDNEGNESVVGEAEVTIVDGNKLEIRGTHFDSEFDVQDYGPYSMGFSEPLDEKILKANLPELPIKFPRINTNPGYGQLPAPCLNHNPVQHRDRKPPWCKSCGLTKDRLIPVIQTYKKEVTVTEGQILNVPPGPIYSENHMLKAKLLVMKYFNDRVEKTDGFKLIEENVYIVLWAYVLGGWKAHLSTTIPDSMYYEVTYDFLKKKTYVDAYRKFENVCYDD